MYKFVAKEPYCIIKHDGVIKEVSYDEIKITVDSYIKIHVNGFYHTVLVKAISQLKIWHQNGRIETNPEILMLDLILDNRIGTYYYNIKENRFSFLDNGYVIPNNKDVYSVSLI